MLLELRLIWFDSRLITWSITLLNSSIPFSTSFSCTNRSSLRFDVDGVRCNIEDLVGSSVAFFGNGSGLSASTLGKKLIVAFSLMKLSALRLSSSSGLPPGNPTNPFVVIFPMLLFLLLTDVVLASLYDELLLSHSPMMGCCDVFADKDLLMVSVV